MRTVRFLVALLSVMGLAHFVAPRAFDEIVPEALPGSSRGWTYASGAAELLCAATIAWPRTRRAGSTAAAVLFVLVFPANVKMALDWSDRSLLERSLVWLRLPLQVPLVLAALSVRRKATRAT
jgi:uncharacterized membrane protein